MENNYIFFSKEKYNKILFTNFGKCIKRVNDIWLKNKTKNKQTNKQKNYFVKTLSAQCVISKKIWKIKNKKQALEISITFYRVNISLKTHFLCLLQAPIFIVVNLLIFYKNILL